jgi:hypothetical protein
LVWIHELSVVDHAHHGMFRPVNRLLDEDWLPELLLAELRWALTIALLVHFDDVIEVAVGGNNASNLNARINGCGLCFCHVFIRWLSAVRWVSLSSVVS